MTYKYEIGDLVFLRTDVEQKERLVTGIQIRQKTVLYGLACETEETWHYEFEISRSKDLLK